MSMQSDFDGTSQEFLHWFRSQEGATFHPSLELADLRSRQAGRGIIATQDIPAETDLFTIPRSAIICVETSELAREVPELFSAPINDAKIEQERESELQEGPDPWLDLILALLYESMHPRTSKWVPYLQVLPSMDSQFDTLMFWSQAELSELQASAIVCKIGKESAEAMFREKVLPVVAQYADIFYSDGIPQLSADELIQRCHVIGSMIMSYAFDLQPDEDEEEDEDANADGWIEDRSKPSTMGMVPMADMLNADAEFNAHLSHGEDALTMTSLRIIKAGEEILNYYGPLPTGELLRRYGYVSQKHSRYDVVELSWQFVKETLQRSSLFGDNKQALKSAITELESVDELDESDGFLLEREAGDPSEEGTFSMAARFAQFPEELIAVISTLVEQEFGTSSEKRKRTDLSGDEAQYRILQVLEELVSARVAQYTTTLEEDLRLSSIQARASRSTMALAVRIGEKQLLSEVHAWLKEKQTKYTHTQDEARGSRQGQKRLKR